jgi:hypothetical protein
MNDAVLLRVGCFAASVFLVCVVTGDALAATDSDKEAKREMRRLQAQLSATQKEKAALSSEKEAIAAEVNSLKKQINEVQAKGAVLEKKSGGQRKQLTELLDRIQEADKNLQDMTQLFLEANKTLDQVQIENDLDRKQLDGQIRVCEKKNTDFYHLGLDLMERYQSKGIMASMLQAEPFTQLEKVRIQNLMQEYRDKADASRFVSVPVPVRPPKNAVSGLPTVPPPGTSYSGVAGKGQAASAPAAASSNPPPVAPAAPGDNIARDVSRS